MDATGAVVPMTDDARVALLAHQTAMASRGLRTLALASRQFAVNPHGDPQFDQPPERDMTLVAIVGVKVQRSQAQGNNEDVIHASHRTQCARRCPSLSRCAATQASLCAWSPATTCTQPSTLPASAASSLTTASCLRGPCFVTYPRTRSLRCCHGCRCWLAHRPRTSTRWSACSSSVGRSWLSPEMAPTTRRHSRRQMWG